MATLITLFVFTALTLVALRMYTHLAVHERRVIASWDRLDTLLTQRNGELTQLRRLVTPRVPVLERLHQAIQRQETARRRGDLSTLAESERQIRDLWDDVLSQQADLIENRAEKPVAARVHALDLAIADRLTAYNAAVSATTSLRSRPFFAVLAGIGGHTRFQPIQPPAWPGDPR
ncbi:hypothetical protein [Thioalkalivibrio sp. ALJT]|uniref:hypothetical protein n=1 Tax=Thioalkalivibrio sp. ALJT TaxID=1158146 RepID=UPI00035E32D9|nr:hypothetical protein [Thioalkalivibrio sp. ALJT]